MKKSFKVLVILTIGLVSLTSNAQIFGINGGIGLANITSPNENTNNLFGSTFGARLGGTIEFDLTDQLYLGSGIGFAKKGASTIDGNFNLLYAELPVGARFDIFEIGDSGYFFVKGGLHLGFLVSAQLDGVKLNIGSMQGDNIKAMNLGFNSGVGVIFNDSFEVGIGVEFGLNDISSTDSSNLKNAMILATFGYKFGQ